LGADLQRSMPPKFVKNCGKQCETFIHAYIEITNVTEEAVAEFTLDSTTFLLKNSSIELHESLRDESVADIGSQTNRQTDARM